MYEVREVRGGVDTTLRVAVLSEEDKKPRNEVLNIDVKDDDPLIVRPGEDSRLISTIKVVAVGANKVRFEVVMATADSFASSQVYEGSNEQRSALLICAFCAAVVQDENDRDAISKHIEDFLNQHLGAPAMVH